MSERGSFVTEHIYCSKCFEAIRSEFDKLPKNKYFVMVRVGKYPIIAGKIGGLYPGEEIVGMEELKRDIDPLLCHPVRVAVLAEEGEAIIWMGPKHE